jgi:hypothetical protein
MRAPLPDGFEQRPVQQSFEALPVQTRFRTHRPLPLIWFSSDVTQSGTLARASGHLPTR